MRPPGTKGMPLLRDKRWRAALGAAALVVAVLAVYTPALQAGFIWDDDVYLTSNRLLTEPGGLRRIWFSLDSPSQYFPLVYTTFMLERSLWGLDPFGYHLVNVILHLATALCLWLLLARLGFPAPWLSAAFFALHPVQVESVAWVTERKNVLSGVLVMLTALAWVRFSRTGSKGWYQAALAFFLLALSAKTTAVTLPPILLLLAWYRREDLRRRALQLVPFLAAGLAMGLITVWWEWNRQGTAGPGFHIPWGSRLIIAGRALWFYLWKLVFPWNLVFSYPRWEIAPRDFAQYLWPAAVFAAVLLLAWAARRGWRGPAAALGVHALALAPLLGFVPLYTFQYSFVADHYQYLALIGPMTLVAAGATRLDRLLPARRPGTLAAAVVLALLGVLSWRQTCAYRDVETLWRRTLAVNPSSWMARNNLGHQLMIKGAVDEALEHFHEALLLKPDYAFALNNQGIALTWQGRTREAEISFRRALDADPRNLAAWVHLGNLLDDTGRPAESLTAYHRALEIDPASPLANSNLGVLLHRLGRSAEALEHFNRALELEPADAGILVNRAEAFLALGRRTEALGDVRQALLLVPGDARVTGIARAIGLIR